MKRKNKFPDSFAFIKDDKRPVSEEVKMADCIYFGSEKTIPFNECEEIAKLLAQYGYGSIKRFAKGLLEKPLDDVIILLEEAAK